MARARRQVWADRVERWCASGLPARDFAARIGVNANTLASWRWKLRRSAATEDTLTGSAPLTFVEVAAPDVVATDTRLEVVLQQGQVVRVPRKFDEASLRRVLDVLERR